MAAGEQPGLPRLPWPQAGGASATSPCPPAVPTPVPRRAGRLRSRRAAVGAGCPTRGAAPSPGGGLAATQRNARGGAAGARPVRLLHAAPQGSSLLLPGHSGVGRRGEQGPPAGQASAAAPSPALLNPPRSSALELLRRPCARARLSTARTAALELGPGSKWSWRISAGPWRGPDPLRRRGARRRSRRDGGGAPPPPQLELGCQP
ncbi:laforin-like [Panicum virgatum]|uniref:laforin-like n=1 Tax=Panicum virgatum TaxID=38727 RepID=UPI0019D601B8|nr:laforin-like [Panicum virgatum]